MRITKFDNRAATHKTERVVTLEQIKHAVLTVSATSKDELPLLKGATFGDKATDKGSLRNDANMLEVDLIEGDYDALDISPEQACAQLDAFGVRSLVYTSPSYRPDNLKWRVLCPLSRPHKPAERKALVARLNGALGGVLARESFTASQSFYYGRVGDNPAHAAWIVEGKCIDTVDGLAEVYPRQIPMPSIRVCATSSETGQDALRAACATFARPDAEGQRHQFILAATAHVAPFIKGSFLDEAEVVEAIRDACTESGRPPHGDEVESAMRGAVEHAQAWEADALWNIPAPEVEPIGTQTRNGADLIFDRDDPLTIANWFVDRRFACGAARTLHYHRGDWFRWASTHYESVPVGALESDLYRFLAPARARAKNGTADPFKPDMHVIGRIIHAMRSVCGLPDKLDAPCWIGAEDAPAAEIIACSNGLLHVPTRRLMAHTPRFFGHHVAPFDYDPAATAPQWLQFLKQLWGDDPQSIAALREWFGLCLTGDTSHHKILFMVGPKRSGKGTIANTLSAIVGTGFVTGATLAGLGERFGLQPFIGKQIATFGDVRFGNGGGRESPIIVEHLLKISGGDVVTVDIKNRTAWTGKLPTRLIMLSNELPRLPDASGALAGRFIILRMNESFFGREDRELGARLLREMSGIFAWSLGGLDLLQTQGKLTQPESGTDDIREMEELASPVLAFVRDRCLVDPRASVACDTLFSEALAYLRDAGTNKLPNEMLFGRDLKAALGSRIRKVRGGNGRTSARAMRYDGIRLNDTGTAHTDDADLKRLLA